MSVHVFPLSCWILKDRVFLLPIAAMAKLNEILTAVPSSLSTPALVHRTALKVVTDGDE